MNVIYGAAAPFLYTAEVPQIICDRDLRHFLLGKNIMQLVAY